MTEETTRTIEEPMTGSYQQREQQGAPALAPRQQPLSEEPKKMSRAEAGRKGGLRTKERHGEDYFGRIGRMGGKKGGESTKQRYGVEFYRTIGRKGGSR